jgi:hypothetical protein
MSRGHRRSLFRRKKRHLLNNTNTQEKQYDYFIVRKKENGGGIFFPAFSHFCSAGVKQHNTLLSRRKVLIIV